MLWLFTENENRFSIKFLINANQIKLKYSLLTSSFIECCNKDVINLFTLVQAFRSLYVQLIRSFISIDS